VGEVICWLLVDLLVFCALCSRFFCLFVPALISYLLFLPVCAFACLSLSFALLLDGSMVENTILRLHCNCPCRINRVDSCITRRSRPEDTFTDSGAMQKYIPPPGSRQSTKYLTFIAIYPPDSIAGPPEEIEIDGSPSKSDNS